MWNAVTCEFVFTANPHSSLSSIRKSPLRCQPPSAIPQLLLKESLSEECRSAFFHRRGRRFWRDEPWIPLANADPMPVQLGFAATYRSGETECNIRCGCMRRYTIGQVEEGEIRCCPMCEQAHQGQKGLGLFAEDQEQPMCRTCGKKHAPTMVALLDLAQTAERVGRGCRHLLTPPMESLLDLARAAENYSCTAQ
jgi:hypothetical protein